MRWTGKIVGGLVGALAGPVGALIGAVIGHGHDVSEPDRAVNGDPRAVGAVLFETVFAAMGYLAKADGRVTEAEIGAARGIMRELNLSQADVRRAIAAYTRGKQPGYPMEADLARLARLCGPRHDLLRLFMEIQVRAALAGNDLSGPVRGLLVGLAGRLGFDARDVSQMEAQLRLQQGRSWSAPPPAPADRLASAYAALGIAAGASDAEVKKAYRQQMSEHHPDKLVARGLPESMQDLAKEKTQRIREAYEVICAERGLR